MTNNELIIVLSRNYSTGLGVIRSLGEAGFTVDLIYSSQSKRDFIIPSSSKFLRKSTFIKSRKNEKSGSDIFNILMEYDVTGFDKVMLFPADDFDVSVIDAHSDELKKKYVFPYTKLEGMTLNLCMEKTFQAEQAKKYGIPVPKEWIVGLYDELVIPEDMVYPCFVKPLKSNAGFKSEMKRCRTKKELRMHLKHLQSRNRQRNILIQEYLPIENEIDFSGVCLGSKVIVPGIIKKTHVARHEKGVTLSGYLEPFDVLGNLCDSIKALLGSFEYYGMFDMELNYANGQLYFNEINFRSGGPNFSYFLSGANLPAVAASEILGNAHNPDHEAISDFGKSFLYEKVAWEDKCYGLLSQSEYRNLRKNCPYKLIEYSKDPVPGFVFRLKNRAGRVKAYLQRKRKKISSKIKKILYRMKHRAASFFLRYPQRKNKNDLVNQADIQRVLVFGRNYCTNLCMAKSFGRAGYAVDVLRVFQTKASIVSKLLFTVPETRSKYIQRFDICVSYRKEKNIVDKLIRMAKAHKGHGEILLVPADDLCAAIADKYKLGLQKYFVMSDPDGEPGKINQLMNKDVQKALAIQVGLPVVNSCLIKTQKGQFEIPESVTYPCFIKPNVSKNASKSRIMRCDDKDALTAAIASQARSKDAQVFVEDFINIRREYSVLGVSDGTHVNGNCFFGQIAGGHGAHVGVAMKGEILPVSYLGPLAEQLNAYVLATGFVGMYDIDLIEDTNGKMYFVEMNMRLGASGYAFEQCSVNLCGIYGDYALNGIAVKQSVEPSGIGKTFASEKVLYEEYLGGEIAKADLKNIAGNTDILFIKDEDDMRPYRYFRRYLSFITFKRFTKRLLGR